MEKLRDYSIAEIRDDLPNRADETESAEDSGFSPSGDTLKGFAITPSERIKALRNLRLAGINPTSAAIREEVLALREQSATGDSSPPGFTLPVVAESSQSAFLVDVLQKELIERDRISCRCESADRRASGPDPISIHRDRGIEDCRRDRPGKSRGVGSRVGVGDRAGCAGGCCE